MGEVFAGPGFRTCSRAGCGWPAVATLSFDYQKSRAWLQDLLPHHDPATYDLCSVHAGRCSPPKGWTWEDRRAIPEPAIHSEPAVEGPNPPAADILIPLQATIPEA